LIAAGLSPFDPSAAAISAGRLMLSEIQRYLTAGESFAFETTLSGRGYARLIPKWQSAGYEVTLVFLRVSAIRIALDRVKARTAQGGHHISPTVIRRRFRLGWENFERVYQQLVDNWRVYDNSGDLPVLIANGRNE